MCAIRFNRVSISKIGLTWREIQTTVNPRGLGQTVPPGSVNPNKGYIGFMREAGVYQLTEYGFFLNINIFAVNHFKTPVELPDPVDAHIDGKDVTQVDSRIVG